MQYSRSFRFVFTGGPGSGKTTVIEHLQARGYLCIPEVARSIIQRRLAEGLSPRPGPQDFATQILAADIRQYDNSEDIGRPIFFDRGIGDALGMVHDCGSITVEDARVLFKERPYDTPVFVFPAWEQIYRQDRERDQTFDDAVAIDERVRAWYECLGATIVEVPRISPEERAAWILQRTLLSISV